MRSTLITVALFASVALAQPARMHKPAARGAHAHNGRHAHHKRAIVYETVTDIVTEIIDVTSTVWVDADSTTASSTTSTSVEAAPTTLAVHTQPAQFYAPASSSTTPVPTTSSIYIAPTPSPSPSPEPTTTTSVYSAPSVSVQEPAPALTTTTTTSVPIVETAAAPMMTTTTTSAAAAIIPTETYAALAATTTVPSSSYSGTCSEDSPCDGSLTFYDAALGACGWTNDGTVESVVALPYGMMGTQSNGNPFCGMTITIKVGSKTTTAKVVDKCMGCVNNHIDVSRAAFDVLADEALGVTQADWYFN